MRMTQLDIDATATFIETQLRRVLEDDHHGENNINAIGISAAPGPASGFDYRICFMLDDITKTTIPPYYDIGTFRIQTLRKSRPGIPKRVIEFVPEVWEKLRPGDSIGNDRDKSPGTLAAIVIKDTKPYYLSCQHVLGAKPSTVIHPAQQGADNFKIGTVAFNDAELDCSLASINDPADANPMIRELDVVPDKTRDVRLNDKVIKYGLTTKVTHGIVTVIKAIRIGGGGFRKRQIIIETDPLFRPRNGEISDNGDSGALWLSANEFGKSTTEALGMNTAGGISIDRTFDYAFATEMISIANRFDLNFKPNTL